MSRPSNRSRLVEGTLRCLERLPPERVTARAITGESGANLNSITHHFGAKRELVTEAVLLGLERWNGAVAGGLAEVDAGNSAARISAAVEVVVRLRRRHPGLARNYVAAFARAQHDRLVRERLAGDLRRGRRELAERLGLGGDETALAAAGLVQSLILGTLAQTLVGPPPVRASSELVPALRRLTTGG